MDIETYFEHFAPDDIRIKGTRIGIESVLYEYIHREQPAKNIARRFPSLTLEQIYATILYYHQNTQQLDSYITEWLEFGRKMREEQRRNPPPVVVRLRVLKQQGQRASIVS